jgi:undecaprenyl-diphosphatase
VAVWQAMVLGLVQGLTEFLPVSSSGHLLIARALLGAQAEPLLFEIVVHVGTLLSVVVLFWRDIVEMLTHPLGKLVRYLVVATLPAVAVTLLLGDVIEAAFGGRFLGVGLLVTAALLSASERKKTPRAPKPFAKMRAADALVMGGMQAVALFPGISRSGATITGGLFRGLDRKLCARFSFLMSVPAILGSLVFKFKDLLSLGGGGISPLALAAGFVCAAVSGFFAMRFMLKLISEKKLWGFAAYVAALGVFVLVCQFAGVLFAPLF